MKLIWRKPTHSGYSCSLATSATMIKTIATHVHVFTTTSFSNNTLRGEIPCYHQVAPAAAG